MEIPTYRAGSWFVPLLYKFMLALNIKISSLHAVKAYRGRRCLAPPILNLAP